MNRQGANLSVLWQRHGQSDSVVNWCSWGDCWLEQWYDTTMYLFSCLFFAIACQLCWSLIFGGLFRSQTFSTSSTLENIKNESNRKCYNKENLMWSSHDHFRRRDGSLTEKHNLFSKHQLYSAELRTFIQFRRRRVFKMCTEAEFNIMPELKTPCRLLTRLPCSVSIILAMV